MARSPQEVFAHHVQALGAGDLDEIVADYADGAVFISPSGVLRGKDGIRSAFTQLLADLPNADWDLKTQIYEGDVLFLEWAADAGSTRADDGIDTFVFRDGQIQVQTVRYTLQQVRCAARPRFSHRGQGQISGHYATCSAAGSAVTKPESGSETLRTVLVAGVANIVVLLAKLVAGVLTGSSAMLAEAAHSFADTLNQAFLFTSVRQGRRPADADHPFGYGQERYFWSLLAAFGIFVAGAGFSVFEGILSLHSQTHNFVIAYVVLAVCAVAEGTSFLRATRQLRGEARRDRHRAARPRQDQPGHHGQGGAVRGHRGRHRPGPGRRRAAAGAADRVPGLRRRRVHRDRRAADRGGRPARPGQPRAAHRPGRRPEAAADHPG